MDSIDFAYGVASGDPDTTSVIVWTAVAVGQPIDIPMAWDIALDANFDQVVGSGTASAATDDAHTVRVLADNLAPGAVYWYRFRTGSFVSRIGRTRTMPAQDPDRFTLAVSSCQSRDNLALWDNHVRLATDTEVDLVVWLGDFIYEEGARELEGYRDRYREARGDDRLQASSAAHPWVVTWDDHEVVNDYDAEVDPLRRAAGYRAWWEFTPTRLARPLPAGQSDEYRIYRSIEVASLARVLLLDCRQYQTESTVLGAAQLEWLGGQLDHESRQTIIASPVVMSSIGVGETVPDYAFEVRPDEQNQLRSMLAGAPGATVISGDLHASMQLNFAPGITEWMAPPLSSSFPPNLADALPLLPILAEDVVSAEAVNGYLRLRLSGDEATATVVS